MLNKLLNSLGLERRNSFSDGVVTALLNRANAGSVGAQATAAVEACSSLVARAFAAAEVTAPTPWGAALTPEFLSACGRALIRYGQFTAYISRREAFTILIPCHSVSLSGGARPSTWRYRLSLAGPSETFTRQNVEPSNVIHVRYQIDASKPWEGIGPLQAAVLSGTLSSATVNALGLEASGPCGYLLPVAGESDPTALVADLKALKGQLAVVESQRSAFATGPANAGPGSDEWEPRRFGPTPPVALVQQARLASEEIYAACGLSGVFSESQQGNAAREAWRRALFGVLQPLGNILLHELQAKLSPEISLAWTELRASDLSGRARAFQSMTGAGMDIARAAALSGLMESDAP